MTMSHLKQAGLVALAFWVAACSKAATAPSTFCASVLEDAVILVVRDSISSAPAASGTLVVAQLFSSNGLAVGVDTGRVNDTQGLTVRLGALPGRYDVVVKKVGYQDWTRQGIIVPAQPANTCNPQTQTIEVQLQPSR